MVVLPVSLVACGPRWLLGLQQSRTHVCAHTHTHTQPTKKAAATLLRVLARNHTQHFHLHFVEQNLVLWPRLAAREAGKNTLLGEE